MFLDLKTNKYSKRYINFSTTGQKTVYTTYNINNKFEIYVLESRLSVVPTVYSSGQDTARAVGLQKTREDQFKEL